MSLSPFNRTTAALTLACFLNACATGDYTPQGLDLALNVSKKLVKNSDGSVSLTLSGDSLNNAAGAVETFHKLADKRFGSTPYAYSYTIGHERAKRTVTKSERVKTTTATSAEGYALAPPVPDELKRPLNPEPVYFPSFMPIGGGGGGSSIGGGEAAAIFAAAIVVGMIASAVAKDRAKSKPAASRSRPASITESFKTITRTETEEYGSAKLVLRGTARPTTPAVLDKSRTLQILVPADTTFRGKLATGSGLAAANATAAALNGWKTEVVRSVTRSSGYVLKPSLIRWADRSDYSLDGNRDVATLEYELQDAASHRTLQRFVVHAAQPPISMTMGGDPGDFLTQEFAKRWAVYTR